MSLPKPIIKYSLSDASVKSLLPSGYTPLVYILLTGTQYINTGITFNAGSDGFEVECLSTDASQNGMVLASDSGGYTWLYDYNGTDRLSLYINSSNGLEHLSGPPQDLCKHHCLYKDKKYYGDGIHYGTMSGSNSTGSVLKIGDYGGSYRYKGKVYYVRLWTSTTLSADLRPALRDSDGAIGMYDLVSNTFKTNSGSGTFIAGPPLAIGKGGGHSLPEEYLLVEYLLTTKNEYINTGLYPSSNTKIDITFELFELNTNWSPIFSSYESGKAFALWFSPSQYCTAYAVETYGSYSFPVNTKTRCYNTANEWYRDGTKFSTNTSTTFSAGTSKTIWIFGYEDGRRSLGRIYQCKFYESSTITRNFIPCYRKSDMKPGMYDVVNGVFYTNSGSGEFILGPSVTGYYSYETNAAGQFPSNPYDKNVYFESDGSVWMRIFHHNNPTASKFASNVNLSNAVYESADKWSCINLVNISLQNWEFMLKLKNTSSSDEVKYRWIQYYNPYTSTYDLIKPSAVTNISGYSSTQGGIYRESSLTYFRIANAIASNWFGALGCWTVYNGGIPGYPNTTCSSGYMDLYIRVDNISNFDYSILYKDVSCMYDSSKGFIGNFSSGSSYCELPLNISLSNFSLACTLKTSTAGTWKRVFWNGEAATSWASFRFGIMIDTNNKAEISVSNGSSSPQTNAASTTNVCDGNWHHIVGTYNSGTLKTYIDGILEKTSTTSIVPTPSTAMRISGSSAGERFNGLITNCMLFDVCLTDAQVKELYGG